LVGYLGKALKTFHAPSGKQQAGRGTPFDFSLLSVEVANFTTCFAYLIDGSGAAGCPFCLWLNSTYFKRIVALNKGLKGREKGVGAHF